MKKVIYIIIFSILISANSLAAENSKNGDVKDCFEVVNRGLELVILIPQHFHTSQIQVGESRKRQQPNDADGGGEAEV